ncbi:bifunctional DNA primase/polymerase [Nocardia sp. NPDC051756]|uniref:bifunctional DNA primase/polymerase n=1 Tax=Nocardia sp. NPDC051756 TaxID=3154751 RepID=UPI0034254590
MSAANPLRDSALQAAERGWHVFPLRRNAKTPALEGDWTIHATTDPDQIRNWWNTNPHRNIAIATGLSGLLVIDIDIEHRRPGSPSKPPTSQQLLARLAAVTGDGDDLRTFAVRTPSVINGLVRALFNVINEWSRCVFASLNHCYQEGCNNDQNPSRRPDRRIDDQEFRSAPHGFGYGRPWLERYPFDRPREDARGTWLGRVGHHRSRSHPPVLGRRRPQQHRHRDRKVGPCCHRSR